MRTALAALLLVPTVTAGPALAQTPTSAVAGDGVRSFSWPNGDVFTGTFHNGLPNGPGTFRTAAGLVHTGQWHNGCLVTDDGYRVAVFTTLRTCPPAARRVPRHPPFPRPDFR